MQPDTADPASPPLQSIELRQFLGLEIDPPESLLGNLLYRGSQAMVYGPAGVGKTYLLLAMGIAVASGMDLLEWKPPRPVPVLYVDGEMIASEMQKRLRALMQPINGKTDHPCESFHLVTPDFQPHGIRPIDQAEGKIALFNLAMELGVGLVVLDNLSCLTNPEEDNQTRSWQPVQELLLSFRRCGIACIVGHHSGKKGQQRGTSKRADILDVVLKLSPSADLEQDPCTRINVEMEKARGLTAQDKQPFVATLEPHPLGGLTWNRGARPLAKVDQIREMLLDGMSPGEVAAELRANRSYVYRLQREMISSGELKSGSQKRRAVSPVSSLKRRPGDNRRTSLETGRGDK